MEITVKMIEELKERVDRFGRLKLSRILNWPYTSLSNKLLGYNGMSEEDYATITGCILMHEKDGEAA